MIKSLKPYTLSQEKTNQPMSMANLFLTFKIQEHLELIHMIKSLKLFTSNQEKINQLTLMVNLFLMLKKWNLL
jgi:saccharopine dehydrogenase-like NADP-dependent oxidoreductase